MLYTTYPIYFVLIIIPIHHLKPLDTYLEFFLNMRKKINKNYL